MVDSFTVEVEEKALKQQTEGPSGVGKAKGIALERYLLFFARAPSSSHWLPSVVEGKRTRTLPRTPFLHIQREDKTRLLRDIIILMMMVVIEKA